MKPTESELQRGRFDSRVIIEGIASEVDGGRFPAKTVVNEPWTVEAHIHADGHDCLAGVMQVRFQGETQWTECPLTCQNPGLDLWTATFTPERLGVYEYTFLAWIDEFATWHRDILKKMNADQAVDVERQEGILFLERVLADTEAEALKPEVQKLLESLKEAKGSHALRQWLEQDGLDGLLAKATPRRRVRSYEKVLKVWSEPKFARTGAWYELFPRSCSDTPGEHGTFIDVEKRLPYIANMGFDVIYLPPIHPIGEQFRKGPNNSLESGPDDPGSPWAIGGKAGGHRDILPELGTLEDFRHLIKTAETYNINVAIDIAFQCSPDHPYVKARPEWFHHRPDGTIKYAENPPKKYQDIYPLNFECEQWQALWDELTDVIRFWCQQGVRIFRVDNPHTKAFDFWEYAITTLKAEFPDTVFLAEAFTRPWVMHYLAKLGFSQSYSYFTWRNTKEELTEYFTELTAAPAIHYMRANLFANTPDINPTFLQHGGIAAYKLRLVLAATLGGTYGIYGPVYELAQSDAMPNSEEYRDSEKYQIRHWDLKQPHSIQRFVARVNQIRQNNRALDHYSGLAFHDVDNDQLLAYSKTSSDGENIVIVVVNLDPHNTQQGWMELPLNDLGLGHAYEVQERISGCRYRWEGPRQFVSLDPHSCPAHIFVVTSKSL